MTETAAIGRGKSAPRSSNTKAGIEQNQGRVAGAAQKWPPVQAGRGGEGTERIGMALKERCMRDLSREEKALEEWL